MAETVKKPRTKKAPTKAVEPVEIVAFKGFDPKLACRGYQYEVGKTFEHNGRVEACEGGFHACENPWDVLSYYPLVADNGVFNRFCTVRMGGQISRHGSDSKIASGRIVIEAELKLPEFIAAGVKWLIDATKTAVSAGTNILSDAGKCEQIIGSSGHSAQIGSSGHSARIGSSGDYAQIGSSGHSARIGSSGDYGVIAAAGMNTTAHGSVGTWIALPEFEYDYGAGRYKCIGFATGCIGQDGLEPDVAYRAQGGKLVRA